MSSTSTVVPPPPLTDRQCIEQAEQRLLQLMRDAQAAQRQAVTPPSTNNHIQPSNKKSGVSSASEATSMALSTNVSMNSVPAMAESPKPMQNQATSTKPSDPVSPAAAPTPAPVQVASECACDGEYIVEVGVRVRPKHSADQPCKECERKVAAFVPQTMWLNDTQIKLPPKTI